MVLRVCLTLALVLSAVAGFAQKEKDKTIATILLPVVNKVQTDKTQAASLATFIRVKLLQPFKDRSLNVLSPAFVVASSQVMNVEFEKPGNWTPENLKGLAERHKARYVIGLIVEESGTRDEAEKKMAFAKVQVSVYDYQTGKFALENKLGEFSKEAKASLNSTDAMLSESEVIAEAAREAMKEFLAKLPKAPKK